MIKWIKVGRTVNAEGTTTYYEGEGTGFHIESRKRHIEHANGVGTWDYTTYVVLKQGIEVKALHRLKDAMAFAEELG